MKKLNRKGFTLIELLAVIVILGILMLTAIPAVSRAITKSRKNTFWQNAKQYIQAAQTPFLSGEYVDGSGNVCGTPAVGEGYFLYLDALELEGGSTTKSAFGALYNKDSNTCRPRVIVTNQGKTINEGQENAESIDKIVWYFVGTDQSKNGIDVPVAEGKLNINSVKVGKTDTNCTTKVKYTDSTNTEKEIEPTQCLRQ